MARKKKPTEKQKPHTLHHTQGEGPSPSPASEPAPSTGPTEEAAPDLHRGFPIVGIGASAGGLAAFEAFFSGMPADSDPGMAFVYWCSTWPRITRAF